MPVIDIIAGPTASGKSALALQMAQEKNGVVINADSMQIYHALPLLTAQPSAADQRAAPHRLYGCLPVAEPCSAARWRMLVIREIEDAFAGGRHPVVTGGTGLYINSLVNGLSPIPDVPSSVRAEAMALQSSLGNPGFHAALNRKDPVMATRLHPNDTQRLIRAWEVMTATGRSLAEWQHEKREASPPGWIFRITLILPDRRTLYERCNGRFLQMMDAGALEETRHFIEENPEADQMPVKNALGFHALERHLRNAISLDEAIDQAQTETRQYAKRQMTWFRHQVKPADNIAEIAILDA